jgi:hypothetical protein
MPSRKSPIVINLRKYPSRNAFFIIYLCNLRGEGVGVILGTDRAHP